MTHIHDLKKSSNRSRNDFYITTNIEQEEPLPDIYLVFIHEHQINPVSKITKCYYLN